MPEAHVAARALRVEGPGCVRTRCQGPCIPPPPPPSWERLGVEHRRSRCGRAGTPRGALVGSGTSVPCSLRISFSQLFGVAQGCIGRKGASEAGREAVRQAVGGGCRSGWGRLLSVTNAVEAGTWRQGGISNACLG